MKVFQDEDDASCVELTVFSGEETDFSHHVVEVLALYVGSYVVEVVFCLECLA